MPRRSIAPRDLADLALTAGTQCGPGVTVTGVSDDSRTIEPGDLFFCIRGSAFDGHDAALDAVTKGAVGVVAERVLELPDGVAQLVVPDVRGIVGPVASAAMGEPSARVTMVGVTGTNGKTSTASFIGSLLGALGHRPTVIGTLTGTRTTPEAIDLQGQIADAAAQGCTHVVMEVSSHALELGRVNGTRFDVAVFTNLSRDHLDFHGTMEDYFAAKCMLFDPAMADSAVINVDDEWGARLASLVRVPAVSCTVSALGRVDVAVDRVEFDWRGNRVVAGAGGSFAVPNCLMALETVVALGHGPADVSAAARSINPVNGRFESVPTGEDWSVIVDYAHTPEALRALLTSARTLSHGRLMVVFGCGGDRDRGKRPAMGAVVAELADVAYVTSDNPRSEDPEAIISGIIAGMGNSSCETVSIVDRGLAIESAISAAGSADIVVIAGKGHEPYQEIAGEFLAFSDVEVARTAVAGRRGTR